MFVRVCYAISLLLVVSSVAKCEESNLVDSADDVSCARVPPSLWCSCDKLSEKCGFTEKCKQFRSGSWNKPVSLTLLYESLCPGCSQFITQGATFILEDHCSEYEVISVLSKVSTKISEKYLKIELIPFGNAKRQVGIVVDYKGIISHIFRKTRRPSIASTERRSARGTSSSLA